VDDQQKLLVVIGAAVDGTLLSILIVLALGAPTYMVGLGGIGSVLVAGRLVRRL
jgi:hypothetical protein